MLVSIESPYHSTDPAIIKRNVNYAILAMKDSAKNYGENPYLSHLLLTQTVVNKEHVYVDDTFKDPYGIGRDAAIELTNGIRKKCDKLVFYINFGYSNGMLQAKEFAIKNNIPIEERYLHEVMMMLV